jgi:Arc/MetJ-type ribon-helix-helix transcriptional regulator
MSHAFSPEIQQLIDVNLATGRYGSEAEVLKAALHALSDHQSTLDDIRQGRLDYEQGLGEPLTTAMDDVRRQLDLRE